MQQGPGADVAVEQSSGTPQLAEAEPQQHEGGLVPQEHRHRVPGLEPRRQQGSGGPVALSVGLPVRVRAAVEQQERFVRMLGHFVQESSENAAEGSLRPPAAHAPADGHHAGGVTQILREKRLPQVQQNHKQNQTGRSRDQDHQDHDGMTIDLKLRPGKNKSEDLLSWS